MERHIHLHSHVAKAIFVILMTISGILFAITMINFGVGFVQHMHDTDGWRAVLRILVTPFTDPVWTLPIASVALRYMIVFVLNYLMPVLFWLGMYFVKQDYLLHHEEVHSY
ncbi:hypothetical protein [Listeria ilorinensis]|uniref:hypothetical protein n=1 Tax=Listeria ilorinensis TaxID=2867439 RepID=UPI001EF5BDB9|nr:hypothetical protein [Listeria ilorinensis]